MKTRSSPIGSAPVDLPPSLFLTRAHGYWQCLMFFRLYTSAFSVSWRAPRPGHKDHRVICTVVLAGYPLPSFADMSKHQVFLTCGEPNMSRFSPP